MVRCSGHNVAFHFWRDLCIVRKVKYRLGLASVPAEILSCSFLKHQNVYAFSLHYHLQDVTSREHLKLHLVIKTQYVKNIPIEIGAVRRATAISKKGDFTLFCANHRPPALHKKISAAVGFKMISPPRQHKNIPLYSEMYYRTVQWLALLLSTKNSGRDLAGQKLNRYTKVI